MAELTAEELAARRPMVLAQLVLHAGPQLFDLRHPRELAVLVRRYRPRLSPRQLERFARLMEDVYGTAFARRAGLPVGPPNLRLAG